MYNDVLTLIKETEVVDSSTGDVSYTTTSKNVFCETKSIGMSEFYQANATGFKPSIKFVIADYRDYDDETIIKYESKLYDIIRTYRTQDTSLEITCERRINKNE